MGLTVFIDRKRPTVTVLEWFRDERAILQFARAPLVVFETTEFRQTGLQFIRKHFEAYATIRIGPGEMTPVLPSRSDNRFLRNQRVIRIEEYPPGTLVLMPYEFRKFSLNGLVPLPVETERRVPLAAESSVFWKAFDEVLAATE
jgi:hypothetical protein